MGLHRPPVPARHGAAVGVEFGLDGIPGEHGVAALDVAEVLEDRLARQHVAARAEVPLEVANPQHKFRDGRRARVHLDAEELVRVYRETFGLERERRAERLALRSTPRPRGA